MPHLYTILDPMAIITGCSTATFIMRRTQNPGLRGDLWHWASRSFTSSFNSSSFSPMHAIVKPENYSVSHAASSVARAIIIVPKMAQPADCHLPTGFHFLAHATLEYKQRLSFMLFCLPSRPLAPCCMLSAGAIQPSSETTVTLQTQLLSRQQEWPHLRPDALQTQWCCMLKNKVAGLQEWTSLPCLACMPLHPLLLTQMLTWSCHRLIPCQASSPWALLWSCLLSASRSW